MAGAIVPDDWDGVSYTERRVVWPNSEKWLEILRGGLSQPAFLDFWDADTGDEESATETGKNLISLNLVDGFYPGLAQGEQMQEAWFYGDREFLTPNSITAHTWTDLVFPNNVRGTPLQPGNEPAGWNGSRQQIRDGLYGLWMYDIFIGGFGSFTGGESYFRILDKLPATPFEWKSSWAANDQTMLHSSALVYVDIDADFWPQVYIRTTGDFSPDPALTYFSGRRVGQPVG